MSSITPEDGERSHNPKKTGINNGRVVVKGPRGIRFEINDMSFLPGSSTTPVDIDSLLDLVRGPKKLPKGNQRLR